jgi:hypothetical protein
MFLQTVCLCIPSNKFNLLAKRLLRFNNLGKRKPVIINYFINKIRQ